ncbi:unnamed protein product, partial [marine sediment metagenome]
GTPTYNATYDAYRDNVSTNHTYEVWTTWGKWFDNQTTVTSTTDNLTLTGTKLGINGANILTWLQAIFQPIGAYLTSTELNESYLLVDENLTCATNGVCSTIYEGGSLLSATYQAAGTYLTSTEINASYPSLDTVNTFEEDQVFSGNITLSQDQNVSIGAGYQTYNGSCWITYGATTWGAVC